MDEDLIKVGAFNNEFNILLGISLPLQTIFQSKGLSKHLIKRKHFKCLKYIDCIPEIIENPDYIGISPNEDNSIELVKKYKDSILIGIKLDIDENYFYVSTIFDVQDSKIQRRLHSGRLILYNKNV